METILDIRRWFEQGKNKGATRMIVIRDTSTDTEYPTYVEAGEQIAARIDEIHSLPMHKVMEVYDLALPMDEQLNEEKAWHL